MGWVADKLRDDADYPRLISKLWIDMRDSIGQAVSEFNKTTSEISEDYLAVKDCAAMGQYCRRVTKAFGALWVEVFLDEETRTLNTSQNVTVCGYRVKQDRSAAEFFVEDADGPAIAVEHACQLALKDFIFTPIRIRTLPRA
jgi:hypothetical protein